jgi:outer membrane receptor protein involved in Fe transport
LPGPNGNNLPVTGSYFNFLFEFGGQPSFQIGKQENAQRQYNFTDTYSWMVGRHALKFGVDWRRLSTYSRPQLVFLTAGFPSEAAVLSNNVGSDGYIGPISSSPAPVEPVYKNFSAFAKDEWKVTSRMSLSVGLRWDVNPAPTNLTGPSPYTLNQITNLATAQLAPAGTSLWSTDWDAFAPRLGVAYKKYWRGIGRLAWRATGGRQTAFGCPAKATQKNAASTAGRKADEAAFRLEGINQRNLLHICRIALRTI